MTDIELSTPSSRSFSTAGPFHRIHPGIGFYEIEEDEAEQFVWARRESRIEANDAPWGRKILRMDIENIRGEETELVVTNQSGDEIDRLLIAPGRGIHHAVSLPETSRISLGFRCSHEIHDSIKNGDPRELAMKFYGITIYPARTPQEVVESDCWVVPDQRLDGVFIELTTRCNLKCVICPQAVGRPFRPKDMPSTTIGRLLPLASHAATIDLHGLGEPLLAPEFHSVMRALPEPSGNPKAFFHTNGTILTDEHLELLLCGKLRGINFSLDAATEPTFRFIRGHELAPVLRNIEKVVQERNRRGLDHPKVYLNMTLLRENLDELKEFVKLTKSLGADAAYLWHLNHNTSLHDWVFERDGREFNYKDHLGLPDSKKAIAAIQEAHELAQRLGVTMIPDQSRRYLPDNQGSPENSSSRDQHRLRDFRDPFKDLFVTTSGHVRLGCFQNDYFTRTKIDQFTAQDSLQNSEEHRAARYLLAHGRPPASFRGGGTKYLEGTQLTHPDQEGIYLAEPLGQPDNGLLATKLLEDPPVNLRSCWTTKRVQVMVSWRSGLTPLAAQIFLHTPDLGQGSRQGRLLLEGRPVFEGLLPTGTWSRDILLDAKEGKKLRNLDEIRIELEVRTFRAKDSNEGKEEDRGVGLIALAIV